MDQSREGCREGRVVMFDRSEKENRNGVRDEMDV